MSDELPNKNYDGRLSEPPYQTPGETMERLPVSPDPFHLLQSALDRGMEPDKLGRLVDLVESWKQKRAVEAYSKDMNLCQSEMPTVLKDSENKHTKIWYASLEKVNQVIKPVYTQRGFSISFSEGEARIPEEVRINADVLHEGGHERKYFIDLPRDGKGIKGNDNMTPIQAKGSTFSYGKRYLVCMIFNVTIADEDTDGNNGQMYLSDEQAAELNDLISKCRAPGVDEEAFQKWLKERWKWLDCEDMNTLRKADFARAKDYFVRTAKGMMAK